MTKESCESTNISGESALDRLKKKYGTTQTGGKGSVRRKRVPAKKKRADGVSGKNLQLTTKLVSVVGAIQSRVDGLTEQDSKRAGDYLEPIHQEFLKSLSKSDRKNNKVDHHQTIRQTLTEYLSVTPKIHTNLIAYSVKHLSVDSLEKVIRLLEIHANVYRNQEYQNYVKPSDGFADSVSDQQIEQSYRELKLKPEETLDPVSLRHYYLERREQLFLRNTTQDGDETTNDVTKDSPLSTRLKVMEDAYLTIYSLLACNRL